MYIGELNRQTGERQRQISEARLALDIAGDRLSSTFIEIKDPRQLNSIAAAITHDTGFEFMERFCSTTDIKIPTQATFYAFSNSRLGREVGLKSALPTEAIVSERLVPTGEYDIPRIPIIITKESNVEQKGKDEWKFYAAVSITPDTVGLVEVRREGLSNSSWAIVNPKGPNEQVNIEEAEIGNLTGKKGDSNIKALAIHGTFLRAHEIALLQSLLIDNICLSIPGGLRRLGLPKGVSERTHGGALEEISFKSVAGVNAIPNITN